MRNERGGTPPSWGLTTVLIPAIPATQLPPNLSTHGNTHPLHIWRNSRGRETRSQDTNRLINYGEEERERESASPISLHSEFMLESNICIWNFNREKWLCPGIVLSSFLFLASRCHSKSWLLKRRKKITDKTHKGAKVGKLVPEIGAQALHAGACTEPRVAPNTVFCGLITKQTWWGGGKWGKNLSNRADAQHAKGLKFNHQNH